MAIYKWVYFIIIFCALLLSISSLIKAIAADDNVILEVIVFLLWIVGNVSHLHWIYKHRRDS